MISWSWILSLTVLRGETATFDISINKGEVLVEPGRRITARHIRALNKAKVD